MPMVMLKLMVSSVARARLGLVAGSSAPTPPCGCLAKEWTSDRIGVSCRLIRTYPTLWLPGQGVDQRP